jgi:hypothetical protein
MSERRGQPDLEAKIAEFVRTYIATARSEDLSKEPGALCWLCTGLEELLGQQLEGCDGWNGWIDGIVPATDRLLEAVKIISTVEVSVRGYAMWAKASGVNFSGRRLDNRL